ncbi:MAG: SH3 domain-containing protein [Gemmatimonadota bacterium]
MSRYRRPVFLAVAMWAIATPVSAQDEIIARGNQAYQDGDFPAAIEAYEAVRSNGFTSAGLEYNLGNAWFKAGELGRSILHWERARRLDPSSDDVLANLELARSLTVDEVEALPTFWLVAGTSAWVNALPRVLLLGLVLAGWLAVTGGVVARMLGRADWITGVGRWSVRAGALILVLFGSTLFVREAGLLEAERAIVMVEAVPVRSAPAEEDDLVLFEVHEGTRLRIDEQTGSWAEVVLDDGKVGWIPLAAVEVI